MAVTMILIGFMEGLLCYFATRHSRIAWAFATSLNGTLALMMLFGSPSIRDNFEIAIGIAVLPSFAVAAATVLLSLAAEEF